MTKLYYIIYNNEGFKIRIPEIYKCDFCGKENPEYKNKELPVITNLNWEDGIIEGEHIMFCKYDICEKCLLKITNIHAGFRGIKSYIKHE